MLILLHLYSEWHNLLLFGVQNNVLFNVQQLKIHKKVRIDTFLKKVLVLVPDIFAIFLLYLFRSNPSESIGTLRINLIYQLMMDYLLVLLKL